MCQCRCKQNHYKKTTRNITATSLDVSEDMDEKTGEKL